MQMKLITITIMTDMPFCVCEWVYHRRIQKYFAINYYDLMSV